MLLSKKQEHGRHPEFGLLNAHDRTSISPKNKTGERNYKPDSVAVAIHLGAVLPRHSSVLPGRDLAGSSNPSCLDLLRTGVTKHPGYPESGRLLPYLSTLAAMAVFFSMALTRDRSLWVLPSVLARGVRTFLEFSRPLVSLSGQALILLNFAP